MLAAALLAAAILLSACGSSTHSGSGSGKTTGSASSAAGSVKPGASVTLAVSNLPTSADIDPNSSANGPLALNVGSSVAGTLFGYEGSKFDPDQARVVSAPSPQLALSATPSANGLTWTFKLRPHVLSQDGNPLTAADVVWTIKRALHTAQDGATLLKGIHIDTGNPATARGPLTVQVHLTSPSSLVVKTFGVSYLGILDEKAIAAHSPAGDPWGEHYLSTHSATFGPYEVSVAELPSKEEITANPHYWRGTPQITRATFTTITDDSTRLEAVLSGQVDYAIGDLSINDLAKLKSSATAEPDLQPDVNLMFYLAYVMKSDLVKNPLVRRAVSLAVNRRQVADVAYQNEATPVTSCVPKSLFSAPSSLADVNPAAGDVSMAKKLYAEGHGPKTVSLGYPTALPAAQSLAEIVRSDLQSLGVTTTLAPYSSYPTFLADQAAGKFPLALEGFGPNVEDPGYFLYTLTDGQSSSNLGDYSNPTLDKALQTVETVTGPARQTALASACKLALDQAPIAPLVAVDGLGGASRNFTVLSSLDGAPLLDNMRFK